MKPVLKQGLVQAATSGIGLLQQAAPKRNITIPEDLKSLQKSEVNFFLEKIPSLMRNGDASEFFKLFDLYLEGIITKYEFFDMIEPLILPSEKDNIRHI